MTTNPSTIGRPVGANGEETRQRILAAAMKCVAELGYARATIREISREAQMTGAALYHYFPNKVAIIEAAFRDLGDATVPRVTGAADEANTVLDKLFAVLDEGEHIMREYPYAVAFDRAIRVDGAQHLDLAMASDNIFGQFEDLVRELVEQAARQGALAGDIDPGSAANALFAVLRGLYDQAATTPPADVRSGTVEAVKLLIRGSLFDASKLT